MIEREGGVDRHHVREPAELRDLLGVAPLVDEPDDQEQPARREAVVDHLQHAALEPERVEREHAEHHEAEVADRGVGDQLLHVLLHQRHEPGVDDADDRERHHPRHRVERRLRQERQREADEAVGPHLQQHARQDHRARGRRLDVGVGQPGVEREHRHLDREAEEEGEEHPELQVGRDPHLQPHACSRSCRSPRTPAASWRGSRAPGCRAASPPSPRACTGRT